jgi:shikimate dehydrogenase
VVFLLGALSGSTRLVGLIGNPVSHSLSPRMQNAAFAACGLDWAYVPLPVESDRLREAVRGLVALGFEGANVTIPHKTAVLEACDEVDEVASTAASANTLIVRDGRVQASSTDGLAVTDAVDARGARVLLLGAGGSAQAVGCALLAAGAAGLEVAARRAEAAEALAAHLDRTFPAAEVQASPGWPPAPGEATLLVQTTPLRDEVVVQPTAALAVVDLAYRADGQPTALVAAAQAVGCVVVVDGLEVLLRQGAASFTRWTGLPAPVDVMRAALRPPPPAG